MAWFIKNPIIGYYYRNEWTRFTLIHPNEVKFWITWKVWILLSILDTFSFGLNIIRWGFIKNSQVVDFRWAVVWKYFNRIDLSATSIILNTNFIVWSIHAILCDFRIFAVWKIQTRSVGLVRTIFTYIRAFNREYSCFDSELIRPQSALYSKNNWAKYQKGMKALFDPIGVKSLWTYTSSKWTYPNNVRDGWILEWTRIRGL